MFSSELICGNCGWRTVCGREDAIGRLRLIGLLRRDPDPDEDLLRELFFESAPRMTCPLCKEQRLRAADHEATSDEEDFDWQAAVLCEICREAIDPERVEALPGGTASVGVACCEPKPHVKEQPAVSFGSLVREATAALKRAQAAGRARFDAPEQPKPKKNRISLA